MKVARHGFDPGVGHADDGFAEIAVGESDRLEHGASAGAISPVGDATAAVFRIHGRRIMPDAMEECCPK